MRQEIDEPFEMEQSFIKIVSTEWRLWLQWRGAGKSADEERPFSAWSLNNPLDTTLNWGLFLSAKA